MILFVATLVAPWNGSELEEAQVKLVVDALKSSGAQYQSLAWLEPGRAVDLWVEAVNARDIRAQIESALADAAIDVIIQEAANRSHRLLIADMDSTMIKVECIDELADFVGKKAEVAVVTEAAMRGELDFEQALKSRVALLQGLKAEALSQCYEERVAPNFMPGGKTLIETMNAVGAVTILVSGGFTFFVDRVASHLGFQKSRANVLDIAQGVLTGRVLAPIVTATTKRQTLMDAAQEYKIALASCLAIGDGANDIPMIEAAGLGIAYHAKPKTQAAAQAAIRYGDLSALLFAQGYPKSQWVS